MRPCGLNDTGAVMTRGPGQILLEGDFRQRVVLSGEIDLSSVQAYLAENDVPTDILTIDAAEVTFMDSSGLKFLLDVVSRSPDVVLCSPSERLRELLELTGTSDLVPLEIPRRITSPASRD